MNSAKDLVSALAASTSDVPTEECGPEQDCHERIKLAIFFDGTGNNRDADAAEQKWSNVSRLYDAHRDEPDKGIYKRYVSGIGTKLNREEPLPAWTLLSPAARASALAYRSARDAPWYGGATGAGAESRLESGDLILNDRLENSLRIAAEKAGRQTKDILDRNEVKGFEELNKALGRHRLIRSIELSVFGFSRGAALARAFISRVKQQCKSEGGRLSYQGIPITFKFLGIFDTVASMGRPAKNDFESVDLWLPQELENCVHYVAAHEFRYSFPVDLIRQNGGYRTGWKEVALPGTHSDVGGGYTPTEQGRTDALGRVPLCAMFREASLAGVRLFAWNQILGDPITSAKFDIPQTTRKLYDAYMAAVKASGSVEKQIQAHMKPYYAYKRAVSGNVQSPDEDVHEAAVAEHLRRIEALDAQIKALQPTLGTRLMEGLINNTMLASVGAERSAKIKDLIAQRDEEQRKLDQLGAGKAQIAGGEATMAEEAAELRRKQKNGEPLVLAKIDGSQASRLGKSLGHVVGGPVGGYLGELSARGVSGFVSTEAEAWMLEAYYGPAPSADVIRFFDTHVHDSKAAFLGGAEPWSYFRHRGVWESARATKRATKTAQRPAGETIDRTPAAQANSELPPGFTW